MQAAAVVAVVMIKRPDFCQRKGTALRPGNLSGWREARHLVNSSVKEYAGHLVVPPRIALPADLLSIC